jgi:hypothetical protein
MNKFKLKLVDFIKTGNTKLFIGVIIGVFIVAPATYAATTHKISQDRKKEFLQKQEIENTEKDVSNGTDKDIPTAKAQNIPKSTNSNTSPTPKPITNPTPKPTTNPTPKPTTNPTELSNCVYQNGSKAQQNCPSNPPLSWSDRTEYHPCVSPGKIFVNCSNYSDTIAIKGILVRAPTSYEYYDMYCVFIFSNGNARIVIVGNRPPDSQIIPDCSYFNALDTDVYPGLDSKKNLIKF